MRTRTEINNLIGQFNDGGRQKTFAEFIAELFKDKFIEIYLGDAFEEVKTEQQSNAHPAVFCGKVMGAYKECLVLNSFKFMTDKQGNWLQELGNIVFVSERSIRALVEIDNHGTISDLFIKSGKQSNDISNWDGDEQ